MAKLRIALDFDGVFVNHPPFVPKRIIEWLYKGKNGNLSYRFPGRFEQKIRILSHAPTLRPPIKKNLLALKKSKTNDILLISSRFSFLKHRTDQWDKKNKIFRYFKKIYFNKENSQPHLFKDKIIKQEKIDKYIDDDLDLLIFLADQNPKVKFFWLSSSKKTIPLPRNLQKIKDLGEFFEKYA